MTNNKEIEKKYALLLAKTKAFVEDQCPKGAREMSHGFEHFEAVANNTQQYLDEMKITNPRIKYLALIVAWLHDIADHKYDKDGSLARILHAFLNMQCDDADMNLIKICIEKTSYSKQVKQETAGTLKQWFAELGDDGKLIRDLVSDADKNEALDEIGLTRCIEYTKEFYHEKKQKLTFEKLQNHVNEHAKEKLLRLKDNYIYTSAGKKMAEVRHENFVRALNKFLSEKQEADIKGLKEIIKKFLSQAISGVYTSVYRMQKNPQMYDLIKEKNNSKMYYILFMTYINNCWHNYGKKADSFVIKNIDDMLEKNIIKGTVCIFHWLAITGGEIIKNITLEEINGILSKKTVEEAREFATQLANEHLDLAFKMLNLDKLQCSGDNKCNQSYNGKDLFEIKETPQVSKEVDKKIIEQEENLDNDEKTVRLLVEKFVIDRVVSVFIATHTLSQQKDAIKLLGNANPHKMLVNNINECWHSWGKQSKDNADVVNELNKILKYDVIRGSVCLFALVTELSINVLRLAMTSEDIQSLMLHTKTGILGDNLRAVIKQLYKEILSKFNKPMKCEKNKKCDNEYNGKDIITAKTK